MATVVDAPRDARAPELHVVPHQRSGRWRVAGADGDATISWHASADEAMRAARRGGTRIYLHDRYQRVRRLDA
ncbi:MAG TPA: hypothetical protein VD836_17495 [Solirubrobacteraceae bacterium]|nr:hypothetical protein [Solirubrobacteraceae bacterium]